jgi:xylan 1,4-beta-xylosidase
MTLSTEATSKTALVHNPIIRGFNPDPSIVRRGMDYYIATSTFEWFPAVQIHHSTDLANWSLIGHALTGDSIDLRGVPASGGVWAPGLSVDPVDGRFYLVFSIMKSQVAEVFDVDNYVVWADDVLGPWSEPQYLNSIGFDPSIFHDDDGTKWLVTLEWETRPGHEHPGWIVLQRFDPETATVGKPIRIHHGTSDRGAMEAPHLYKHEGTYYLVTAEGGTGFGHGVCLARSDSLGGPYESDPGSPFITSTEEAYFGRNHRDFLRPEWFNPRTSVQKAGHGSLIQAVDGRWYVAHLSARVVPGTQRSILGRETSIQPVRWEDGWLRLEEGGVLAREEVSIPGAQPLAVSLDIVTDFTVLSPHFAVPRGPISTQWCRPGADGLTLTARDSLHSLFDVSLVATRLRGHEAVAETELHTDPEHFTQSAGLTLFYDNRNFLYLRVSYSEDAGTRTIAVVRAATDLAVDDVIEELPLADGPIGLRLTMAAGRCSFSYGEGGTWKSIAREVDSTYLSDDAIRGFTGQFVGVVASDAVRHCFEARFARFALKYTD